MLELTRLNGSVYFLNPDWLLTVEATPDTILRLANDETLMVRETPADVVARFEAYKARTTTFHSTQAPQHQAEFAANLTKNDSAEL